MVEVERNSYVIIKFSNKLNFVRTSLTVGTNYDPLIFPFTTKIGDGKSRNFPFHPIKKFDVGLVYKVFNKFSLESGCDEETENRSLYLFKYIIAKQRKFMNTCKKRTLFIIINF